MMPVDRSLSTLLARAPGAVYKQIRRILATRYWARYFRGWPDHPALDEQRAAAAVRDADQILFLCWGNICRSPMAERYLRARLKEVGRTDVTVQSAGLGNRADRASPDAAVDVAARYGVDLSRHESVCVTESLVAESDCIFLMDYHNYHLFATRWPTSNMYFLSVFAAEDDPVEIPDPAGGDIDDFERVYESITGALDRLAAIVESADEASDPSPAETEPRSTD